MEIIKLKSQESCTVVHFARVQKDKLTTRTNDPRRVTAFRREQFKARWIETNFKPDGWITLEVVNPKLKEEDLRKIVRSYLCNVGKINKQHVFAWVRWGVQNNSIHKNKLHFHILYRFEKKHVCTRVMELVWQRHIRKILNKDKNKKVLCDLDQLVFDVCIDHGIHLDYEKQYKDYWAHAYDYKKMDDHTNKGTVIQYCCDEDKHPEQEYMIGCPKYLQSCRKGKCKHYKSHN